MSSVDGSRPSASHRRCRSSMTRLQVLESSPSARCGRSEPAPRAPGTGTIRHRTRRPGGGRRAVLPPIQIGGCGLGHRPRVRGDPACGEVTTLERHVVTGPDGADHLQRFLHEVAALVEVDAEGDELPLEIADADGEGEAAAGQQIERRPRLRDHEGVAVRKHHDVAGSAAASWSCARPRIPWPRRDPTRHGRRSPATAGSARDDR